MLFFLIRQDFQPIQLQPLWPEHFQHSDNNTECLLGRILGFLVWCFFCVLLWAVCYDRCVPCQN